MKLNIKAGDIRIGDGPILGRVENARKFGYHPAVRITIRSRIEWMELDELGESLKNMFQRVEQILREEGLCES
jgi:hypothetical protein